jgi:3-methyl-2-oxobutanoate hydroxymethyltransferase
LIKYTIQHIKDFKETAAPFATLTAYDFTSAQILDEAQIPLILVGDSASMMIYGYDTTIPISMDEMMLIVKAVTRGVKHSLVVADMPFLSYQPSVEETMKNAGLFLKEGNASAVKLEGGVHVEKHINSLVNSGIPVLGHVGLTPQSYHQLSGYKIQGKTPGDAQKIIDDAMAVQNAGAFGIVLECIPELLAKQITDKLTIPTIGIGSGDQCDGQIQVFHDIIGYSAAKAPKHAKQYGNMYTNVLDIVKNYKSDIEKT